MRVRSAVLLAVLAVGLAAAKESSAKVETKLVAPAANITVDEVGFRTAYAAHTAFAFEILCIRECGARHGELALGAGSFELACSLVGVKGERWAGGLKTGTYGRCPQSSIKQQRTGLKKEGSLTTMRALASTPSTQY